MGEGTRGALLVKGRLDEEVVERAVSAAEEAPTDERVAAGLEAVIGMAETDPAATRSALRDLRGDHARLARLEGCLGVDGDRRAAFGLGAALQLALSELGRPEPNLRGRAPEIERWLTGAW
ncbi:MAG TPA: hypothetical protein VHQ43_02375 [Solirubrobacterales bacterium]|jgi:hypothetical protein|nr:hypothetical protein [Solirubrobacterales bacterium]